MTTSLAAAKLRKLVQEAEALLEEIEGDEEPAPKDIYTEGCVLVFTKPGRYGRTDGWGEDFEPDFVGPLKYAAIKAGGAWFLTDKTIRPKTWAGLLDFIGEENYPTIKTISQNAMHRPDWAKPEDGVCWDETDEWDRG